MKVDRVATTSVQVALLVVVIAVIAGASLYIFSIPPSNARSSTSVTSNSSSTFASQTSTSTGTPNGTLNMLLQPGIPYVASDIQGNFTIVMFPGGSITNTLSLSSNSPSELAVRLKPTQVSTGGGEIIVEAFITVSKNTQPGRYNFTLIAGGGLRTFMQTFNVEVVPYIVYTVGTAYFPANLTVPKGSTVTWMRLNGAIDQYDPGEHDINFLSGLAHSPTLSQYQTWSFTFNQAGTFSYYCTYHPYQRGNVTVTS